MAYGVEGEKISQQHAQMSDLSDYLETLLNSGLNITPRALVLINEMNLSIRSLEELIEYGKYDTELNLVDETHIRQLMGNQINDINENPPEISKAHAISEENVDADGGSVSDIKDAYDIANISGGTSFFRPLAKEYDAEIEIIKDPTGSLYVNGEINDFLLMQRDRFNRIKEILKLRPEATGIQPSISSINRLTDSVEVGIIGMVMDKRKTGNNNYIITLEDISGTISVLISEKNRDLMNLMPHILLDQVILIKGYLKVDKQRNSRIIMANKVVFPDIENDHIVHPTQEGLSIALISDTHFGSIDWLNNVWKRFVDFLHGRVGNDRQKDQAGRIKYIVIAGDIVDGVGVYPNQEKRLSIKDIFKQYEFAAECFAQLPDYVSLIVSPGDHDAVHKAVPTYAIPKTYAQPLYDLGITMVGCPAMVSLHGIKTEIFHGTSLIEMKKAVPGMDYDRAPDIMKEFVRSRHLAPIYGGETEIAPTERDWLVLDETPDILHMGHLHKVGLERYRGVILTDTGCFQDQTDYMKSFGIIPDYGKIPIVNIKKERLQARIIDLGDV